MAADFFKKKRWFSVACSQLLAGFITVCMMLALAVNYATPVWVGKSFYFLVSENTHVDVATHETRLDGGAGYLLDYEGNSYVAWSVYFKETDGTAVQVGISEPTKLVKADVACLYFKTRGQKKKKNLVKGALDSFYGCIDVLSQGIAKLDKGLTQQACKRILSLLQKEFSYMEKTYRKSYPQFSNVCADIQASLGGILEQTVYGKDLRHLLCGACDAYIRLASAFSL